MAAVGSSFIIKCLQIEGKLFNFRGTLEEFVQLEIEERGNTRDRRIKIPFKVTGWLREMLVHDFKVFQSRSY